MLCKCVGLIFEIALPDQRAKLADARLVDSVAKVTLKYKTHPGDIGGVLCSDTEKPVVFCSFHMQVDSHFRSRP